MDDRPRVIAREFCTFERQNPACACVRTEKVRMQNSCAVAVAFTHFAVKWLLTDSTERLSRGVPSNARQNGQG